MKYLITAVVTLIAVAVVCRVISAVKPDWGAKIKGMIVSLLG